MALSREEIEKLAKEAGEAIGVPYELVLSVILTESAGDPKAVSKSGAGGLMQLMPGTARDLGLSDEDRFDPKKNVLAGTQYLKQMLDNFNGDTKLALAAYNWGPGNVRRALSNLQDSGLPTTGDSLYLNHKSVGMPSETAAYAPKVDGINQSFGGEPIFGGDFNTRPRHSGFTMAPGVPDADYGRFVQPYSSKPINRSGANTEPINPNNPLPMEDVTVTASRPQYPTDSVYAPKGKEAIPGVTKSASGATNPFEEAEMRKESRGYDSMWMVTPDGWKLAKTGNLAKQMRAEKIVTERNLKKVEELKAAEADAAAGEVYGPFVPQLPGAGGPGNMNFGQYWTHRYGTPRVPTGKNAPKTATQPRRAPYFGNTPYSEGGAIQAEQEWLKANQPTPPPAPPVPVFNPEDENLPRGAKRLTAGDLYTSSPWAADERKHGALGRRWHEEPGIKDTGRNSITNPAIQTQLGMEALMSAVPFGRGISARMASAPGLISSRGAAYAPRFARQAAEEIRRNALRFSATGRAGSMSAASPDLPPVTKLGAGEFDAGISFGYRPTSAVSRRGQYAGTTPKAGTDPYFDRIRFQQELAEEAVANRTAAGVDPYPQRVMKKRGLNSVDEAREAAESVAPATAEPRHPQVPPRVIGPGKALKAKLNEVLAFDMNSVTTKAGAQKIYGRLEEIGNQMKEIGVPLKDRSYEVLRKRMRYLRDTWIKPTKKTGGGSKAAKNAANEAASKASGSSTDLESRRLLMGRQRDVGDRIKLNNGESLVVHEDLSVTITNKSKGTRITIPKDKLRSSDRWLGKRKGGSGSSRAAANEAANKAAGKSTISTGVEKAVERAVRSGKTPIANPTKQQSQLIDMLDGSFAANGKTGEKAVRQLNNIIALMKKHGMDNSYEYEKARELLMAIYP